MNWQAFEESAPDLAAIGRKRIEEKRLVLVGTLRADGSTRISPVEDVQSAGYIVFGKEPVAMRWDPAEGTARIRHPG
jgi:hypothetical protein